MTDEIEAAPDADAPTPESRALDGAAGVPLTLAGGAGWLLADGGLRNALDDLRDRLDADARIRGEVAMADVLDAAWVLLRANYDLAPAEAAGLLAGADRDALAGAVMEALFGPTDPAPSYTDWAASALLANGLDPAAIGGADRPHVLAQLVATGRAVPLERFSVAAREAGKIAALRARAGAIPRAGG